MVVCGDYWPYKQDAVYSGVLLGFAQLLLVLVTAALGFPASLTIVFLGGPVLFFCYLVGLLVCLGLVQSRREAHDPRYAAFWKRLERQKMERQGVKD